MDKLREVTLSSSCLYRGRIINVRQDRVRLPNGKTAFREVVEHPGAVAILALDEQNRVVLVSQYRQPAAAVLLEVPAGKLDAGEEPLQCARRELAEETGLQGDSWISLGWFYLSPGFCNEIIHFFLVRDLSPDPQGAGGDEDETVEVSSLPLTEACRLITEGGIRDAKTVIALQLAASVTA